MDRKAEFLYALRARCPALDLRTEVRLAELTSFQIGGPAAVVLGPASLEELKACLTLCREYGIVPLVLGSGTNVLAPDEGLDRVILRTRNLTAMEPEADETILAQCGVPLARLAKLALDRGLTGLEFAQGIPGTVGGGLMMNAGAYGGDLSQVCEAAGFVTLTGEEKTYSGAELGFGYRKSVFEQTEGIITWGRFRLTPGDPAAIRAKMEDLANRRRTSQPLDLPSAGSTFKRPAVGYAAALIDQARLKGFRVGNAQVSEKHAGFVVNLGGATAEDVRSLMAQVQRKVLETSGVELTPEVRILGE